MAVSRRFVAREVPGFEMTKEKIRQFIQRLTVGIDQMYTSASSAYRVVRVGTAEVLVRPESTEEKVREEFVALVGEIFGEISKMPETFGKILAKFKKLFKSPTEALDITVKFLAVGKDSGIVNVNEPKELATADRFSPDFQAVRNRIAVVPNEIAAAVA
jgi:hypothetical protein